MIDNKQDEKTVCYQSFLIWINSFFHVHKLKTKTFWNSTCFITDHKIVKYIFIKILLNKLLFLIKSPTWTNVNFNRKEQTMAARQDTLLASFTFV